MEQPTGADRAAGDDQPARSLNEYAEAEVHRLLAESGLAEQGVTVVRREHKLILCGEVESRQRRDEIVDAVAGRFPGVELQADIGITRAGEPTEVEELL